MQILELAAKLQAIGLTDKQAKVYVAALFLGPSSAQKIAGQADVNRATTYVIIEELMVMGLVSQSSEGKKKVFVAEPPESLGRYLDSVKKDLQSKSDQLDKLLPELTRAKRVGSNSAPQVFFYRGKEGLTQVGEYNRKHAKSNSTLYGFSNHDQVMRINPDRAKSSPGFRLKKNIRVKTFVSADKHQLKSDPKLLRELKRLPEPAKAEILLQENFAIFENYTDNAYVALVIESPDVVAGLRQLFELAWDNYKEEK